MRLELRQIDTPAIREPHREYSQELDDVRAMIMDVCEILAESGAFDFVVSGFGDGHWPVDVATDMATVLEVLPAALQACRRGEGFSLDFFEQGVERRLDFVPAGADYLVKCTSQTAWQPTPGQELVSADDVLQLLAALGRSFVETIRRSLPQIAAHPWLVDYARLVGVD